MFPDTFDQVTGNANVKRTVTVTGQNIDAWKLRSHVESLLDSRLRGNDGSKKMALMSNSLILNAGNCNHSVAVAGENIDAWKFRSHVRTLLDSRLRGNDGYKKIA